jgi:hypothetical protein
MDPNPNNNIKNIKNLYSQIKENIETTKDINHRMGNMTIAYISTKGKSNNQVMIPYGPTPPKPNKY